MRVYDDGIGIHSEKIYLYKGLDIAVMNEYDLKLFDKHSYQHIINYLKQQRKYLLHLLISKLLRSLKKITYLLLMYCPI